MIISLYFAEYKSHIHRVRKIMCADYVAAVYSDRAMLTIFFYQSITYRVNFTAVFVYRLLPFVLTVMLFQRSILLTNTQKLNEK